MQVAFVYLIRGEKESSVVFQITRTDLSEASINAQTKLTRLPEFASSKVA